MIVDFDPVLAFVALTTQSGLYDYRRITVMY